MDVVQSNIERIGGLISLDNRPGRGLSIILRVPLTLTIIPGLIIRAGGQHFAIPRAAVVEILHDNNQTLRISRSEEHTSEPQSLMRISYAVFCLKKKNKN